MNERRANTSRSNWGKIVDEGMGGFLNPPGHPEHRYSVHSVYGDTFSVCLSAAAYESDWLNCETVGRARGMLKKWDKNKSCLDVDDIQSWVYSVMGYFKNSYSPKNKDGSVLPNYLIKKNWNPFVHQKRYLGVLHIQEYYPDFKLNQTHLDNAKWGQ